jgi:homoserine dehydrogenase
VTLLGLGAVGRGVYEHLLRQPDRFEIVAIAVRRRAHHEATGVPGRLLFSLDEALEAPSDVVVEAIGGIDEAGRALHRALLAGRHVVTANKAVLAARGTDLRALAEAEDKTLAFSAAVGGVVPVVETLRELRGPVARIEGVLNGTSNFVLDRLADGASLDDAVADAQALGYAEADPTDDLSGLDAARKLTLLAHEALGVTLDAERIPRPGGSAIGRSQPTDGGKVRRLVATLQTGPEGCGARVELLTLDAAHPLAKCRGADNAVVITLGSGRTIELHGRGAGRWPTAESVVGDLLELWRDQAPRFDRPASLLGEFEAVAS